MKASIVLKSVLLILITCLIVLVIIMKRENDTLSKKVSSQQLENKKLTLDMINKCFNLDTLTSYSKFENILDFKKDFIIRYRYLILFNDFKHKINQPKIKDLELSVFLNTHILKDNLETKDNFLEDSKLDDNLIEYNYSQIKNKSNIDALKHDKKLSIIYNSILNQNTCIIMEISKIKDIYLINYENCRGAALNMIQTLCYSKNNSLNVIFDDNENYKEQRKVEKLILNKYNIFPIMGFYVVRYIKNQYELVYEFKDGNDYSQGLCNAEIYVKEVIKLPIKLINKSIAIDYRQITLEKY